MTVVGETTEPKPNGRGWFGTWVRRLAAAAIVLLIVGGASQYLSLRQDTQDQTTSILAGAGLKFTADGINLPVAIIAGESVMARVLMKDAVGNDQLVSVRVTPIGVPIASIISGLDTVYYSISGTEMLRLKQGIN